MKIKEDMEIYEEKGEEKRKWDDLVGDMDKKYRRRKKLKEEMRKDVEKREIKVDYKKIVSEKQMRIVE